MFPNLKCFPRHESIHTRPQALKLWWLWKTDPLHVPLETAIAATILTLRRRLELRFGASPRSNDQRRFIDTHMNRIVGKRESICLTRCFRNLKHFMLWTIDAQREQPLPEWDLVIESTRSSDLFRRHGYQSRVEFVHEAQM